jgi:Ser/Thr protein kinase RdoA (MazF antagonist)
MKFLAPIAPSFSASEAQMLADRHFGLTGEIEPLYSERDQNFRLRTSSGDWTLKIASVEEAPEVID